jgi:hypothetical protein
MLTLRSFERALEEPATKHRRVRENLLNSEPDLMRGDSSDRVADGELTAPSKARHILHFQLVHSSIGRKKTVPVSVGSGGRLKEDAIVVSLHNRLSGFHGGDVVVSSRPAALSDHSGPGFLLEGFGSRRVADIKARQRKSHALFWASALW